ncbi:MAG: hypothetical protein CMF55_01210 [Legionellales bacterium]|nr:hypothetical protein [Legionellales bacterium]HAG62403.1 hypothetical protein [Coxiellaceae bacterium]|tara:strand:- start:541 stop:1248 length:708 start_codon:yes stop_codon:yes gene_type:complete
MISEDDHEQNMKKLNLLNQKIENFKNTFDLIISSSEVSQPAGFGKEIEDAIETARVFPRGLFDQVKAYAQRMHSIDEDKALGLDRIIEEIETYNLALLDAFVPIINEDFSYRKKFFEKITWTPIEEKLQVLCFVDDQNARSENNKLIAYPEFQMEQLLSELESRSDNRPKYSISAFLDSICQRKKGATLVAEISGKLEQSYGLWSGDEKLVLRASLKDIQDELDSQNNKNKKTMG